jgi:hypothetical protein
MGASVGLYWPGMDGHEQTPEMYDETGWAMFVSKLLEEELDAETSDPETTRVLASHITDGLDESEVDWVAASALGRTVQTLLGWIEGGDQRAEPYLQAYRDRLWNTEDDYRELFVENLRAVARIAHWAEGRGLDRITMEINF